MAVTDFGALTGAQKKVWANETWQEGRDQSFWFSKGFIGKNQKDMNSPIHRVTDLTETDRGLSCVMQLIADLQGDGVVGDNELEGNEESLVNDIQEIRIDQLRNGAKSKGRMSEQATVIRFRAQARGKLTFWLSEKIDELLFLTASGRSYTLGTDLSTRSGSQLPNLTFAADVVAASANRIVYGDDATSEATLVVGDTMTWDLIKNTCSFAKRKKIKPIRQGGKEYYAMVLSTEQARDLKGDSDYININKDGAVRGTKNPLFTGALAVVDGVILHEHNKVINTQGATSGVDKWGTGNDVEGAQGLLFGAQSLGLALIGSTTMNESDNQDYGNRQGLSWGRKLGMLKPQFKSRADGNTTEDFGLVSVKTAAAL